MNAKTKPRRPPSIPIVCTRTAALGLRIEPILFRFIVEIILGKPRMAAGKSVFVGAEMVQEVDKWLKENDPDGAFRTVNKERVFKDKKKVMTQVAELEAAIS